MKDVDKVVLHVGTKEIYRTCIIVRKYKWGNIFDKDDYNM